MSKLELEGKKESKKERKSLSLTFYTFTSFIFKLYFFSGGKAITQANKYLTHFAIKERRTLHAKSKAAESLC